MYSERLILVTKRKNDRQNYDSHDRPRVCSRGKNRNVTEEQKFKANTGCVVDWAEQCRIKEEGRQLVGVETNTDSHRFRIVLGLDSVTARWSQKAVSQSQSDGYRSVQRARILQHPDPH